MHIYKKGFFCKEQCWIQGGSWFYDGACYLLLGDVDDGDVDEREQWKTNKKTRIFKRFYDASVQAVHQFKTSLIQGTF